jgi:putative peptidoglycan lipid II flippase
MRLWLSNIKTFIPVSNIGYKILTSGILVSSLLFVGKICAFFKELLVAQKFGVSDSLETFLIAFVIPSYFINILVNSISPVFMSTLIEFREKNGELFSHKFLTKVITYLFFFLISLLAVLFFFGKYIIFFVGGAFNEEKLLLTLCLFYWLIFYIPLRVINSIFNSFLDSKRMFFLTGLTPLGTTLTTILALLFLFEHIEVFML